MTLLLSTRCEAMEGRTYKGLERPSLVWSKDVGKIRSCLGKGRKGPGRGVGTYFLNDWAGNSWLSRCFPGK